MNAPAKRKPKVAIIGAGMGGLCAAVSLHQRGYDVHVYERAPELGEYGAGLQLGPNCFRVFKALGLGDRLRASAHEPTNSVSFKWDDASTRFREPMKGHYEPKFGAPYLLAHRGDLHKMFRDSLPARCVTTSKTCVGYETRGKTAAARFADGSAIEADIVVGADGVRSAIRRQMFGAENPRFTQQMAWRAIVPIDCIPRAFGPNKSSTLESAEYFAWLGPNGHVICYPIGDGSRLNIFAGHVSETWVDESWTTPSSKEELIEAHAGWNEALINIFNHVGDVFKWGIFDRDPRPDWRDGRVVVLGDAAHATMPTLAQGANMAIEDGYVIGRCLDAHENVEDALKAFVGERQPRTARVTLQSRQQFANNRMVPPPPALSRDWLFEKDVTIA